MKKIVLSLSLLALFLQPCITTAQEVLVTPESWDFGEVLVGESAEATFTMTSDIDDDLRIFAVAFLPGEDPDFDVIGFSQPIGDPMPLGTSIDFYVTFTPTTAGFHSAFVTVVSNDNSNPIADFLVKGYGGPIPEPATLLLLFTGLLGLAAVGRNIQLE